MIDGHIHLEYGDYTLAYIQKFVDKAVEMNLDEIWLLEHNYMFPEFASMYDSVCANSSFINEWFHRKAGKKSYDRYLALIDKVQQTDYPVRIRFGLEICYFKGSEDLVVQLTKDKDFDFLLGSIHFVGNFAFDHTADLWKGIDVDKTYQQYFEDSLSLAGSGIFDGIGHPDSIKLFGHKPTFSLKEYYEKLAKELSNHYMYADQNSGIQRRCPDTAPLGMDPELIRTLKKYNVPIITSSDAHYPEDVGYKIKELNDRVLCEVTPED